MADAVAVLGINGRPRGRSTQGYLSLFHITYVQGSVCPPNVGRFYSAKVPHDRDGWLHFTALITIRIRKRG